MFRKIISLLILTLYSIYATLGLPVLTQAETDASILSPIERSNFTEELSVNIIFISGILTTDSTWTAENEYHINGNLLVTLGTVLTINPGVKVVFDISPNRDSPYNMRIDGTLVAKGTNDSNIDFYLNGGNISFSSTSVSWNEVTQTGNVMRYCNVENIGGSIGIESAPLIDNCTFTSTGKKSQIGIGIGGDARVINNHIINGRVWIRGSTYFSNNQVSGEGLYITGDVSPTITKNDIVNGGGIRIDPGAIPNITYNNIISNSDQGIWVVSRSTETSPTIEYNNIYLNHTFSIKLTDSTTDLVAPNNWWGTVDNYTINQGIWDYNDDYELGKIIFTPFSNSPIKEAGAGLAPTVGGILPVYGPLTGGTSVTITGTNFIGGATVTIGGTAASCVTVVGLTSITATTPSGNVGAQDVVVTNLDTQTSTLKSGFTYMATPTISSIFPASSLTIGGTSVTITGTNFVSGTTTVTIGGNAATGVIVDNSTSLRATTPLGTVGAKDVVITTPGGSATLAGGFTYIFGVPISLATGWNTFSTPISLDPAHNTLSTILSGLSYDQVFGFNATTQAWVTLTGSYELKPCDAIYIHMISPATISLVVNQNLTSPPTRSLSPGWNLVSLANLSDMPANQALVSVEEVLGGNIGYTQVLSLAIGNQSGWTYIKGNTISQTGTSGWMKPIEGYWVFMINSGTLAGFTTTPVQPPASGGGGGGGGAGGGAFAPSITGIIPSSGPAAGGTVVTIAGNGLGGPVGTVTFGGVAATGISQVGDPPSYVCTTPAHAAGAVDVTVTTGGGTVTRPGGFTYGN